MTTDNPTPSQRIDAKIAALGDWRATTLWRLFNSSLDGKVRRALDAGPGHTVDEAAFTALIRAAVKHNEAKAG